MTDKPAPSSEPTGEVNWSADDQNLLAATLMATPTQRIAWLEEVLQLAYATGALKPTVYDKAHVGHAMSAIVFDVMLKQREVIG